MTFTSQTSWLNGLDEKSSLKSVDEVIILASSTAAHTRIKIIEICID